MVALIDMSWLYRQDHEMSRGLSTNKFGRLRFRRVNHFTHTLPEPVSEGFDPCPGDVAPKSFTPVFGGLQSPDVRAIVKTKRPLTCGPESSFPCVPSRHGLVKTKPSQNVKKEVSQVLQHDNQANQSPRRF